jgi:anti-sigma B factor antagonist
VTEFRCEGVREDDVATVRFDGELDLTTTREAESTIQRMESAGVTTLVLDLRGLRFLDSTGLRVIVAADSRARKEGRHVKVIPGPEAVHRVFRIALLDQRLEFVDGAANGDAP